MTCQVDLLKESFHIYIVAVKAWTWLETVVMETSGSDCANKISFESLHSQHQLELLMYKENLKPHTKNCCRNGVLNILRLRGSALVNNFIAKIQVPSFPEQQQPRTDTHSLHSPTNSKPSSVKTSTPLWPSRHPRKHTLSSLFFFFLVYIHSRSFSILLSPVALSLHSIGWDLVVDAEQQSSPAALKHEILLLGLRVSVSPCLGQSLWERPWVGVSACWLSLDTGLWGKVDLHSGLMRYNWLHSPTSRTPTKKQTSTSTEVNLNEKQKKSS